MTTKEFAVATKSGIEKFVDLPPDWVEQMNERKGGFAVIFGDGMHDMRVGVATDFVLREDTLYCKVTTPYGDHQLDAHLVVTQEFGTCIRLATKEWFGEGSGVG